METTNELLMPEFLKKDVPYCAKMKLTPGASEAIQPSQRRQRLCSLLPVSMRSAVEWSTIAARRRPIGPSQIASKETTGDKEWNIDSSGLKDDTESEDQRRDHETQATTKEISSRSRPIPHSVSQLVYVTNVLHDIP
ncbi:hypothetical protein KC320_g112 [Hortaea werneckii]|nr:hypothetical protein KC320_g112 [Hortaea werneckii]